LESCNLIEKPKFNEDFRESHILQQLSYIGLGVANLEIWRQFAVETLGLMPEDAAGRLFLRLDSQAYRIALHQNAAEDVQYVGIDYDDAMAVQAVRSDLEKSGHVVAELSALDCAERQVSGGCWLMDPDGLRIELVWNAAAAATAFKSGLNIGFVTGEGGLGHVVLAVSDTDSGIAFYEKLGFKMSDIINAAMGPDFVLRIAFLHCNSRHHSLAMAQLPGGKRLNHIMVEVDRVDDVMLAHRRCIEKGYQPGAIGRHTNDEMFSFYVRTPSGFDIEYGWGGVQIGDAWDVREYDKISHWGHERA
jgi:2,3-dihydroxybiphenyl 1,2-dioxygenase